MSKFFLSLAKMPAVNIRKQGGAAIIAMPGQVLKELAVGVGASIDLEIAEGVMVARPARRAAREVFKEPPGFSVE